MRKIQEKNSPPENAEEETKQIMKDKGEFEERIMNKVSEVVGKLMLEFTHTQEKRQEEYRKMIFDELVRMNEKIDQVTSKRSKKELSPDTRNEDTSLVSSSVEEKDDVEESTPEDSNVEEGLDEFDQNEEEFPISDVPEMLEFWEIVLKAVISVVPLRTKYGWRLDESWGRGIVDLWAEAMKRRDDVSFISWERLLSTLTSRGDNDGGPCVVVPGVGVGLMVGISLL